MTKRQLKEMYNLQHTFNDNTNGTEWLTGVTKEGKVIDWKLCYGMEMCEAMDSLPWKHWKGLNAKADIENFKVEIVDAWHFLMSAIILKSYSIHSDKTPAILLATEYMDKSEYTITTGQELTKIMYQKDNKESGIEDLYRLSRNTVIMETTLNNMIIMFKAIMVVLSDKFNFGYTELYKLYIGKNALNIVRQKNGYKEGTYMKIWDGEEDNVSMQKVIASIPVDEFDFVTIKEMLTAIYNGYKAIVDLRE